MRINKLPKAVMVVLIMLTFIVAVIAFLPSPSQKNAEAKKPASVQKKAAAVELPTLEPKIRKIKVNIKQCTCCPGKSIPANTILFVPVYGLTGQIDPNKFVKLGLLGPGKHQTTGEELISLSGEHYCRTTANAWLKAPLPK